MSKKRCLVTGGAGFIGSHVVDLLLRLGHFVRVADNYSTGRPENLAHVADQQHLEVVNGTILDPTFVVDAMAGVDWVFHLAALADIVPSIQMPRTYFETNVQGTLNVMEAAREQGIERLVYAASSSCYGIPDHFPTPENAEIRPEYPYALSKYLGEQTVMHWSKVYDIPALSLRLFNVYGPRSRTSGTYGAMFGVFLAQKLAGQPFTIVGDGTQSRDFTYVTDIANAFVTAAASSLTGKIMNVGSGGTYSVNQVVSLLGGEMSYIPKRPGEPDCTFADTKEIVEALGWHAEVSLEEGVAKLMENIDYWKNAPVWTPDKIADATADWFKYLGKSGE